MKNNFIQRSITGILFVTVLTGCIIAGNISFCILFLLITMLTVNEFCNLTNTYENDVNINTKLCVIGSGILFVCFFLHEQAFMTNNIFIFYLLFLIVIIISELYLKKSNPISNWAYSFFSQVYIALPFSLLNVLSFDLKNAGDTSYHYIFPLSVFVFTWLNDTGAYIFGVNWGRHRLFERISPRKSWEGSIGGAMVCIVGAVVFAFFYPILNTIQWIGLALVVALFGTWGDLSESLIKRHWGIKDSGTILPGHGGWLDRFDSTLIAIPAVLLYLSIIA